MKFLLLITLCMTSQQLLASGGGGGGSSYSLEDDSVTQALKETKKATETDSMGLIKSLSKEQKEKLMKIFKDPKQLEKLKSFLTK